MQPLNKRRDFARQLNTLEVDYNWDKIEEAFLALEGAGVVDKTYTHNQPAPAQVWVASHNLQKNPSVTIINSAGDEVEGEVLHNTINQVTITFSAPFSGKAIFN